MTKGLIIYAIAGVLAAIYMFGTAFAQFQAIWNDIPEEKAKRRRNHYSFATTMALVALFVPMTAIAGLLASDFNEAGWRIK